jgi:hypothetical protein
MRNSSPLVARATHLGAVVERHANGPVRQLEPESVLVAVIDPLRDEQRPRPQPRGWVGELEADTYAEHERL